MIPSGYSRPPYCPVSFARRTRRLTQLPLVPEDGPSLSSPGPRRPAAFGPAARAPLPRGVHGAGGRVPEPTPLRIGRCGPGETRPDIRATAGLRVATVMAHADLEAPGRRAFRDPHVLRRRRIGKRQRLRAFVDVVVEHRHRNRLASLQRREAQPPRRLRVVRTRPGRAVRGRIGTALGTVENVPLSAQQDAPHRQTPGAASTAPPVIQKPV